MNDPGSFLCLAVLFLGVSFVALILALNTKSKFDELRSIVENQTRELNSLRGALENQAVGLRAAERRLKELGEGKGMAETPAPPVVAAPQATPGAAPVSAPPALEKPATVPARSVAEAAVRAPAKPIPSALSDFIPAQPSQVAAPAKTSAVPASVSPPPPPAPAPASPAAPPAPSAKTAPIVPSRAAAPLAGQQAPAAPAAVARAAPTPPRVPPAPLTPTAKGEKGGWERRLGIVVPVWFGAIALTLGGAYLVKYTIEHSLISPQMRIALAILLGLGLLITGELLRKKTAMTAQGASASGIAVLYAAFLAATVLYKPPMISPFVGFGLIALVTAAAVALSLRQGMVVAFVGLVGGFFTPYWIGAVSASPGRLFTYMLLLQGGLLVVTRKRQWTGLSALTLLMGLSAALHRLAIPTAIGDAPFIGLFLLFSAGSFVWAAKTWKDASAIDAGPLGEVPKSLILGYVSLVTSFLALAGLALRTRFGLTEWAFLGVLSLATLALGRLDKQYSRLPWVAFALTGMLLGGWIASSSPTDRHSIWLVAAGFGLLWGLGGWVCHHRSASPATWATLSVLGGLGSFGAACAADYLHGKSFEHWGYLSVCMAVLYLLAAIPAALPARRKEYGEANLAAFCVAVSSFLSFAVPLELERQWLTVAWALEAAALAWLLSRLRVRALGAIGIVLAAGVALRLLFNPAVLTYPVGTTPVWNWILYGYGIPVVAFALAAIFYERSGWKRTGTALWWGSGALAFALLTLEVRQGFHPGSLVGPSPKLLEWATYSHAWLALALLLLWASRRWQKPVFSHIAIVFLTISAAKILIVDLFVANPLWAPSSLGSWPVLNWLLYTNGLPVALFALAAWMLGRTSDEKAGKPAAWFSALLAFAFLSFEVRHGFHGGTMSASSPSLREWSTYSTVWLVAGLLLLAGYHSWKKPLLRDLALVFAALAAVKIVIFDLFVANPLWVDTSLGAWPVLNWLVYSYALPVALFAYLGWWLSEEPGGESAGRAAVWFSAALAFVFLLLEVRHGFHPVRLSGPAPSLVEWATYSHVWMAAGLLLLASFRKWPREMLSQTGTAFVALAAVKIIIVDLVFANPLWNHSAVGAWPLLNWLLYIYGLPILGLWALRALLRDHLRKASGLAAAHILQVILLWALISLEVRHFFHPGYLDAGSYGLLESATYGHIWLFLAAGLVLAWRSWGNTVDLNAAKWITVATAGKIVLVDLALRNPLGWSEDLGGTPVFNGLLFVYAIPIALFWLIDRLTDDPAWRQITRPLVGYGNLLLAIVLLTLEVRQYFHRSFLNEGAMTNAENYAYSAAWILFALCLLITGIYRKGKFLRIASLVVMLLAVIKVFLYDLRHLHDLYRVVSLLGLGASLLLISYLFSRFVLREDSGE